jgi:N-acetylglucosamine-6-sulfatase
MINHMNERLTDWPIDFNLPESPIGAAVEAEQTTQQLWSVPLKKVAALALTASVAASCVSSSEKTQIIEHSSLTTSQIIHTNHIKKDNHPNIVLIQTDDEGMNLMPYMPFIKHYFKKHGVELDNSFVTQSLCCSSRTTKFTGDVPHNTGVMTNKYPTGGFEVFHKRDEASTYPVWLQDAGYYTSFFGKFMNQYPSSHRARSRGAGVSNHYVPKGFSYFVSPVKGDAYKEHNEFLNVNGNVDSHMRTQYLVKTLDHMSRNLIKHMKGRPFVTEIDPYAPHSPYTDERRFGASHYENIHYPRTPAFTEKNVSDKESKVRDLPPMTAEQKQRIDHFFRMRIGAVMGVDVLFKHVIETLRQTGQLHNTYILFTSDNGYHMGEHHMGIGKNTPFDTDIRVPLYVAGPGIRGGQVVHKIVSNTDLAPTIADMAGVKPPKGIDGRSFLPLLEGKKLPNWRKYALTERGSDEYYTKSNTTVQEPEDPMDLMNKNKDGNPTWQTEPYSGVRWAGRTPGLFVQYNNGEQEYYDLSTDPYENHNLLKSGATLTTSQHQQLEEAKVALDQLKNCHGNTGPESCFITHKDVDKALANR